MEFVRYIGQKRQARDSVVPPVNEEGELTLPDPRDGLL